jgi:ketosteroid isomerase-like protein
MSKRIADLVQQGVAALNDSYSSGDTEPWRRHVEQFFDPEVVLEAGSDVFTEGRWRGHEGAVGFVANQMEVLDGMFLRLDDYREVDENCVVVEITFGGSARHTGIDVEMHPIHVFRMRDGKVLRWQVFVDRNAALEASGLEE